MVGGEGALPESCRRPSPLSGLDRFLASLLFVPRRPTKQTLLAALLQLRGAPARWTPPHSRKGEGLLENHSLHPGTEHLLLHSPH